MAKYFFLFKQKTQTTKNIRLKITEVSKQVKKNGQNSDPFSLSFVRSFNEDEEEEEKLELKMIIIWFLYK